LLLRLQPELLEQRGQLVGSFHVEAPGLQLILEQLGGDRPVGGGPPRRAEGSRGSCDR